MYDIGRLAPFSAEWNGREIGAVGLHENPIEGRPCRDIPDCARISERHDPRERQVEPQVERPRGERTVLTEAVNDATDFPGALPLEDRERVLGGGAGVNDDRFFYLARKPDEARKHIALNLARRMVIVVVEANLAHGGHLGRTREAAQLFLGAFRPADRVMRVDSDACAHPIRRGAGECDGLACDGQVRADAHDDEADDAGIAGTVQYDLGALWKIAGIEVTVRVRKRESFGHCTPDRSVPRQALLTRRAAVMMPGRNEGYWVFAQPSDWRVDVDAWNAHAMRFFGTRIELDSEMRHGPDGRAVFVVAPEGEASGQRSTYARRCEVDDYARADAADARMGHSGLSLLARRCQTIWVVVREGPSDRLSLRLSAILASILLGPILDASTEELFGVKTARAKLAQRN
jgi:hypothetical protein